MNATPADFHVYILEADAYQGQWEKGLCFTYTFSNIRRTLIVQVNLFHQPNIDNPKEQLEQQFYNY
jgi:hypothetical protein